MSTRAIYQSGPSIFKKLLRLVARTFYSGCCPPRPEGPVSRRKWEKVDTTGIAIVILDMLTQYEWVREERIQQELKIAPKLLLKALRYLEQERILRHESRKEGKRAQTKDIIVLATKNGDTQSDSDYPLKPQSQSYWAIDYPSFWDVLRVRLHLMRFKIKSDVEDTSALMGYICPKCSSRYTSLDFASLLNRQTGQMVCEDCGTEVLEEFGNDGGTGRLEDRQKRRENMKTMLKQMDTELEQILDLVNQAKDITPPDYGCLSDWAFEQDATRKAKIAQGFPTEPSEVDITLGDGHTALPSGDITASEREAKLAQSVKELPPWMVKSVQTNGKDVIDTKNQLKRKAEVEILPPPLDHSITQMQLPVSPSVESNSPAVHSFKNASTSSQTNKKIKIISTSTMLPIKEEPKEEEDGIEWEIAEVISRPQDAIEYDDQWEDIPFNTEAARLADIESDIRSNSGWTCIQ